MNWDKRLQRPPRGSGRCVVDLIHDRRGRDAAALMRPNCLSTGALPFWRLSPLSRLSPLPAAMCDRFGAALFACRKCNDLVYLSETTSGAYRLYDTGQTISNKLANRFVALDEPFPERPKGVHHETYAAKKAKWARMTNPTRSMFDMMLSGDALRSWFAFDIIVKAD